MRTAQLFNILLDKGYTVDEATHAVANIPTGDRTNIMTQPVYKLGDGECACGCGHRPGCNDFLKIASVGEAD
jgi:hypothetical protein